MGKHISTKDAKTSKSLSNPGKLPTIHTLTTRTLIGIIVLSFLGFLDATYLTLLGFTRALPPCTVTHGCERVLTSQFAYVGPIPIGAFGVGYFIIMMVLSIILIQAWTKKIATSVFVIAVLAFIAGIGLIYIQAGILHAFCQYCLLAETIITLIFILASIIYATKSSPTTQ